MVQVRLQYTYHLLAHKEITHEEHGALVVGRKVELTLLGKDVVEVQLALAIPCKLGPGHLDLPLLAVLVLAGACTSAYGVGPVSWTVGVTEYTHGLARMLCVVAVPVVVELLAGALLAERVGLRLVLSRSLILFLIIVLIKRAVPMLLIGAMPFHIHSLRVL